MARLFAIALLALLPSAGHAADDSRLSFLEQEVRNLKRQVQDLTRAVEEARRRPVQQLQPYVMPPRASRESLEGDTAGRWLGIDGWRALKPGLGELEVIESLGAPTSMRDENGVRTLYYAMEIGTSGFLSGNVKLRNRVVVEVNRPTLQ
jgi:hypothetical protein